MNLDRSFFERDTATVARELLSNVLIHRTGEGLVSGRIVETEAYYGKDDPASRASENRTKINEIMWGKGGLGVVYMVHGNWLVNIITEGEGIPGAVLIRAVEPVEGVNLMKKRRTRTERNELTSGPGKLTQAFGITKEQHGLDVTDSNELYVRSGDKTSLDIGTSHRIGVTEDLERELRFFIRGNEYVS